MAVRVLSVLLFVGVTLGDHHMQELKEHYDHLAYIAEYDCQRPQPRVIPVQELFPEEDIVHKAFFPDVTVLHRCDNHVGCCPSEHVCTPKEKISLELPFKVTFLEDTGKHKRGSWMIENYHLDNHTECACQEPVHVDEPLECVRLRESCDALAKSCSKLQTSCPRITWGSHSQDKSTTPHYLEETTLPELEEKPLRRWDDWLQ